MVTDNTFLEHMAACELMYQLMLDDNRLLKTTGAPPGVDFLEQKRAALKQLESALAMLRAQHDSLDKLTPKQRSIIQKTQQIVLKALLLDRENEQGLLRRGLVPARELPSVNRQRPHFVADLYKRQGSNG